MEQMITSRKRKRELVCGSFETDGTSAVANALGDGTAARTGVGTFTVTFTRNLGVMLSGHATLDANTGDQIARDPVPSVVNGVTVLTITIIDISGAAAADTNGPRVNWSAVFDQTATSPP